MNSATLAAAALKAQRQLEVSFGGFDVLQGRNSALNKSRRLNLVAI